MQNKTDGHRQYWINPVDRMIESHFTYESKRQRRKRGVVKGKVVPVLN
jgi:hypothetical protein